MKRVLHVYPTYLAAQAAMQKHLTTDHYFVALTGDHDLEKIKGREFHELRVEGEIDPKLLDFARSRARSCAAIDELRRLGAGSGNMHAHLDGETP